VYFSGYDVHTSSRGIATTVGSAQHFFAMKSEISSQIKSIQTHIIQIESE